MISRDEMKAVYSKVEDKEINDRKSNDQIIDSKDVLFGHGLMNIPFFSPGVSILIGFNI